MYYDTHTHTSGRRPHKYAGKEHSVARGEACAGGASIQARPTNNHQPTYFISNAIGKTHLGHDRHHVCVASVDVSQQLSELELIVGVANVREGAQLLK